jgi:predicted RNase H-like HicB family nuclease
MTFEGRVTAPKKGERYWEVRIPALGVFTQGKSEKDAYAMAADAIETLVEQEGFRVEVAPLGGRRFIVSANDPTPLIARWLHRLRVERGLSIRQAAERLGSDSPEAWARYESGRTSPTVEKLSELLRAIDPTAKFALKRVGRPVPLKKAG